VVVARWPSGFFDSWTIIKDIVLTVGGLVLIMVEVFAVKEPSDAIIIAGLAMSGIGASFHMGAILGGFIGKSGSGSPSPDGSGSSPHSASRGSSDEHR
jgi:hypothetical protein